MSGSRSRRKGVAGELEVRDAFRAWGYDVDRSPNSGGLRIKGDLYGTPPAHIEVKRRERLNVQAAFEQAVADAPADREPLLAARMNRSPWLGVVELDFLVGLLACADALALAAAIAEDYPEVTGMRKIAECGEVAERLRARRSSNS